jgi:hypothetical protein
MNTTFNTVDYAIYLPAVNAIFAEQLTKTVPAARSFPDNLKLDDLAFWREKNPFFYHPYVLYSIGQHAVGSTIKNALTNGGRTDKVLVGDSGGFQIGKGTLKGFKELYTGMRADDAQDAWADADEVRAWIVNWLETYTQFAMTIDMPLWSATKFGTESPFHSCSVEQLTDMTVENLKHIEQHTEGRTQWLNVVQGNDEATTRYWFDAVKWFKHGGWALAGGAGGAGGLLSVLKTVLMMRDEDAFSKGQDWVHVLGVSTLKWAVVLTAVQKSLRNVNPNIKFSFDSSSPFQAAGRYEEAYSLPVLTKDVASWSIPSSKSPQNSNLVNSKEKLPFTSPLANRLTLGHLNVYEGAYEKRRYDSISNTMLTHHNVYVFLKAFEMANDEAFSSDSNKQVPDVYMDCLGIIGEAFERQDWYSYLEANSHVLNQHSKSSFT